MTITESIPVPYADWEHECDAWLNRPFAQKVTVHTLDGRHLNSANGSAFETVWLTIRYEVSQLPN